jgi:hypothetical protein
MMFLFMFVVFPFALAVLAELEVYRKRRSWLRIEPALRYLAHQESLSSWSNDWRYGQNERHYLKMRGWIGNIIRNGNLN